MSAAKEYWTAGEFGKKFGFSAEWARNAMTNLGIVGVKKGRGCRYTSAQIDEAFTLIAVNVVVRSILEAKETK